MQVQLETNILVFSAVLTAIISTTTTSIARS
ncbi:hypothetical protein EV651_13416 [Kribbella sp. VKM Ac-2571]|nr:hypothetical protein EV651_13416 [Kribbella sp. VKM Ac-2571]